MTEEHNDIELGRAEYRERRGFNGPLADPRLLRLAVAGFLLFAVGVAALAVWMQLWWLTFGVIPIAMWAGGSLAGLLPNLFFGTDPTKDD